MHSIKNIPERNKIDTQSTYQELMHILGERVRVIKIQILDAPKSILETEKP